MLVNFSGGIDSAVVVAMAQAMLPDEHIQLWFWSYGQDHERWEHKAAIKLADHFGLPLHVLQGTRLRRTNDVVWQGRNGLMAMQAAAMGHRRIQFGCNRDDREHFADCRPEFWGAMNEALAAYDAKVETPLLDMPKRMVVMIARALHVPLQFTRSCYADKPVPCGKCLACTTRAAAGA